MSSCTVDYGGVARLEVTGVALLPLCGVERHKIIPLKTKTCELIGFTPISHPKELREKPSSRTGLFV
jgi:hypothetical protein